MNSTQITLLTVLVMQGVLWSMRYIPIIDYNGDNAHYLALGQALATGRGYRAIWHPDEPIERQYPPGWPVLLAVCYSVAGRSLLAPKILLLAMALLSTILIWRLFGLGIAVVSALSWHTAVWSGTVMSEIPYMFSWLLAMWIIRKGCAWPWGAIAVVAALLPLAVRGIGLTFVLYFMGVCIMEHRWRSLGTYAAVIVLWLMLPWSGIDAYWESFGLVGDVDWLNIIERGWANVGFQSSTGMIRMLAPRSWEGLEILGIIFSGLIVLGVGCQLRQRSTDSFLLIYLGLYMVAVCSWGPWVGVRYMAPIWPLLIYYALIPMYRWPRIRWTMIGLICTVQIAQIFLSPKKPNASWLAYYDASRWCSCLPDDEIIVCRKPTLTWWLSNHQAVRYPYTTDRDSVWNEIQRRDALILDCFTWTPTTARYLVPALREHKHDLNVLYHAGYTYVLKAI